MRSPLVFLSAAASLAVTLLPLSASAQTQATAKALPYPSLDRQPMLPMHLQHQAREIQKFTRMRLELPDTAEAPFTMRASWDGIEHQLDVNLHCVRADGYQVLLALDGGILQQADPGSIYTFRGTVADDKSAVVAGTLLQTGMQAIVLLEDGRHIEIQPEFEAFARGDRTAFVAFDSADVAGCCEVTCDVGNSMLLHPTLVSPPSYGHSGVCSGDVCLAEVAFDCDFPFYQQWGSSTGLVTDIAQHCLNIVNLQYEREIHISHRVTSTIIRTTAGSEPAGYATATTSGQLLDAMRAHWNASMGGVVRDLAHLLTARFGGVGLAWVGVTCNDPSFSYGLSSCAFNLIGGTNGLTCYSNVIAHELGHNWGADHCACASPPYTMNPSYRPCPLRFGAFSSGQIDAHRDANSGCLGDAVYNDTPAYALEICSGQTIFDSTVGSSTEGSSSCGFGGNLGFNDVWFFYRPATTGTLLLNTCSGSTNFDTMLSVHTAIPGTTSNEIGCNDDSCGLSSSTSAAVTAGQTYWIRVSGYAGATGTFGLAISGPASRTQINDSQSLAMDVGPGVYFGNTLAATNDGTGSCGSSSTSPDVWYRYTPYSTELVTVTTVGSPFDTVLSVFNATGTTELFCNDDFYGLQSAIEYFPTAGASYLIRVSGFAGGAGTFKLNLSGPDSDNSLCSGALTIPAGTRLGSFEGVFATDGSSSCPNDEEPDLYYRFVAPSAGLLVVSTCGTHDMEGTDDGPDTVVSLHSACGATSGNQLDCSDDDSTCGSLDTSIIRDSYTSTTVSSGQVVRIRVSRYSSFQGRKPFRLNVELRPANDNCASAQAIGNGVFNGTLVGATNDGTASCGASSGSTDVWYRYTASCQGLLNVTTCGTHDTGGVDSGVDAVIAVFSSCGGTELACNDDSVLCGTLDTSVHRDSNVQVPVTPGQQVLIRVASFAGAYSGPFTLRTSCGVYVATCIGDGVAVGCPCSNNAPLGTIGGCLNSFALSSHLDATGAADLSADTLVLHGSMMGATAPCTYFQGTAQSFTLFGDGIRCVGGTIVRLKTQTNSGGASQYPGTGDPSVSVRGMVGAPGARYYGGWYRNSASFCLPATFNLTNSILVYWHP